MNNKYIIGCDPYDKLNCIQRLLKKIGFYKNRPKSNTGRFVWREGGIVEFIKEK